jgi:hypothetical protein
MHLKIIVVPLQLPCFKGWEKTRLATMLYNMGGVFEMVSTQYLIIYLNKSH